MTRFAYVSIKYYVIYFISTNFLMNCFGMILFIMTHFYAVFLAEVTWCLLSSATRRFHSSSVMSVGSPTAAVLSETSRNIETFTGKDA